jgi:hypothetical protein
MNRKDLARLIKECRPLMKTASPEQKLRMLKLIREGYRKLNQPEKEIPWVLVENEKIENPNADYLEEK